MSFAEPVLHKSTTSTTRPKYIQDKNPDCSKDNKICTCEDIPETGIPVSDNRWTEEKVARFLSEYE